MERVFHPLDDSGTKTSYLVSGGVSTFVEQIGPSISADGGRPRPLRAVQRDAPFEMDGHPRTNTWRVCKENVMYHSFAHLERDASRPILYIRVEVLPRGANRVVNTAQKVFSLREARKTSLSRQSVQFIPSAGRLLLFQLIASCDKFVKSGIRPTFSTLTINELHACDNKTSYRLWLPWYHQYLKRHRRSKNA